MRHSVCLKCIIHGAVLQEEVNVKQADAIAKEALDQLVASLARGQSDELKRFLAVFAKFPKYGFWNLLRIEQQCPEATEVASATTWKRVGRHVKPGAKGIVLVAPAGRTSERLRFRAVRVFDVSQTEGKPLPELSKVTTDPGASLSRLRAYIAACGISVYAEDLNGALGRSYHGSIGIAPGLNPAQEFATLVHELAHEKLHPFGDRTSTRVQETEAEAVSFAVCTAISIGRLISSSDYIHLHGDARALVSSLNRVQKVAAEIIEAVRPTHRASWVERIGAEAWPSIRRRSGARGE